MHRLQGTVSSTQAGERIVETHRASPCHHFSVDGVILVPTPALIAEDALFMPGVDILIKLVGHILLDIERLDAVALHLLHRSNHIIDLRLETRQDGTVSQVGSGAVHDEVVRESGGRETEVTLGHG